MVRNSLRMRNSVNQGVNLTTLNELVVSSETDANDGKLDPGNTEGGRGPALGQETLNAKCARLIAAAAAAAEAKRLGTAALVVSETTVTDSTQAFSKPPPNGKAPKIIIPSRFNALAYKDVELLPKNLDKFFKSPLQRGRKLVTVSDTHRRILQRACEELRKHKFTTNSSKSTTTKTVTVTNTTRVREKSPHLEARQAANMALSQSSGPAQKNNTTSNTLADARGARLRAKVFRDLMAEDLG